MQFWSGTAFMQTSDVLAVARMFDEAGYDGIVCSDHMIYPRELASPYPDSPTGKPVWSPDTTCSASSPGADSRPNGRTGRYLRGGQRPRGRWTSVGDHPYAGIAPTHQPRELETR